MRDVAKPILWIRREYTTYVYNVVKKTRFRSFFCARRIDGFNGRKTYAVENNKKRKTRISVDHLCYITVSYPELHVVSSIMNTVKYLL